MFVREQMRGLETPMWSNIQGTRERDGSLFLPRVMEMQMNGSSQGRGGEADAGGLGVRCGAG